MFAFISANAIEWQDKSREILETVFYKFEVKCKSRFFYVTSNKDPPKKFPGIAHCRDFLPCMIEISSSAQFFVGQTALFKGDF